MKGLKSHDVLLDNQADVSIVHPSLLHSVQPADTEVIVNGVGGVHLIANSAGYLQAFFHMYVSVNTRAKVLSFGDVEDM